MLFSNWIPLSIVILNLFKLILVSKIRDLIVLTNTREGAEWLKSFAEPKITSREVSKYQSTSAQAVRLVFFDLNQEQADRADFFCM